MNQEMAIKHTKKRSELGGIRTSTSISCASGGILEYAQTGLRGQHGGLLPDYKVVVNSSVTLALMQ